MCIAVAGGYIGSGGPKMEAGMDRRRFLGVGATWAAASGVGPLLARAGALPARPSLRKCLKYGMVGAGGSVLEKFRLLREIGFEGVELDSPSDLDPAEVIAARDATGLAIPGVVDSVHWRDTLGDPDPEVRARGRAGLETALRDCKRFGGDTVLLVPAVVNERIPYDAAYTRSQEEIRKVLPLAAELGVRIALENVWNNFLLSPLEAARYVDELESPHVGWYMDVGNVVNYGWPEQWIRILGSRILRLDVKEFSRSKRNDEGLWKGFDVELGDGDCNWPRVLAALEDVGYSGWASAEVRGGDEARLREIARRMDAIFS